MKEECSTGDTFHGAYGKRCAGNAIYMQIKFLAVGKPGVVKLVGEERMFNLPAATFPKNQNADVLDGAGVDNDPRGDGVGFADLIENPGGSATDAPVANP